MSDSIVDGPGVRWVVFTQGCRRRCRGCHNSHTWDFAGGTETGAEELAERLADDVCDDPLITGVTISGGEPLEWSCELEPLAVTARGLGLSLWIYTGYEPEAALRHPVCRYADAVVCGPYVEGMRTLELPFVGSRNQVIVRSADYFRGG